jgi:DNA polymerase III alpha subunit
VVAATGVLASVAVGAWAAAPDSDWPCQQRKVAEISIGMVWDGPPLGDGAAAWRDHRDVAEAVRIIASRRTPLPEAESAIDRFAASAGADKRSKLTLLLAGVLDTINAERGSIIAGIGRYARRQGALSQKIEHQSDELRRLANATAPAQQAERDDLQEVQDWDTRIFEERRHQLTYVCEQPTLLEKRAFTIGRKIGSLMP